MLKVLVVLLFSLFLPGVSVAAKDAEDVSGARQNYQYLIDQAYIAYPALPAGLLESQAWVATRWQHRVPSEADSHHGMPPVYGLFGLYGTNDYGFVDRLGEVANYHGLTKQALMSNEAIYIDATAAYLEDQIIQHGIHGQSLETFRPIVEWLSGIVPTSEATQFAVQSHVYEVYLTAGKGVDRNAVSIKPQLIDLGQVFSAPELERLGAAELIINVGSEKVADAENKKKSAFSFAGSAGDSLRILDQVNVDYPGATWNPSPNFNSRSDTAISHVVIHTMQGSYAGSINWFLNTVSQVSSHYLMRSSDGQITQMVRDSGRAWHARSANSYSVGIEHEGFVDNADWYTDAMYDESAKLTAYLCNAHAIDCSNAYDAVSHSGIVELSNDFTVKGHQHYPEQVHSDPGINWDWPRYFALLNGGVTPPAVNRLPVADFTSDCTGLVCNFDASASSDADGAIVNYAWDFGDSGAATAMTSSHQYSVPGDYTVQLSVTDDQGAVHQTSSSATVQNTPPPPVPTQKSGGGGSMSAWFLLLILIGLPACGKARQEEMPMPLELPAVSATAYHSIAARIFANETQNQTRYLTYWGAGEDFPSLGIGHFIWFPGGVDAPFDQTFPLMVEYLKQHAGECSAAPTWIEELQPFAAPWESKQQFDELQDSAKMTELRQWLVETAPHQARFIIASFVARWNELDLLPEQKDPLTELMQGLVTTSQGMSAVIDYYNFKGLGSNPRERYDGEGWGLVQVLTDISESSEDDSIDLVTRFSHAAAERLRLRVRNSPPERNESRWLEGWERRVADYRSGTNQFAGDADSRFRVTPYLQRPSSTGMTLVWFSDRATPGNVTLRNASDGSVDTTITSQPQLACGLAYHLAEYRNIAQAQPLPYRHVVELDGLRPAGQYTYDVLQDEELATGKFHTPSSDSEVRFIVYGDSETEPESVGKHANWSVPGDPDAERDYPVDQSAGYSANLDAIASRRPDFVAIAGDLVQSGGEQRDWDEFWRHNAALAATTPIIAAAGNHDYYGGPGDLGVYSDNAARRAIAKFQSYFPAKTYYAVDYGPVVLIVIDANSGNPERSDEDTNWYLSGESVGGAVPAWQAGSTQAMWLEQTLESARQNQQAAFVVFHPAPYTSGIHGLPPGIADGENFSSGLPLRALTPTFLRYGVAAVFTGHDELYEHSIVEGTAMQPEGSPVDHAVHFFTVGIGGDGLRGAEPGVENPHKVFLAHDDANEVYEDGVLVAGGKHYGHAEINVQVVDGTWQAHIEPAYVFPLMNSAGEVQGFERRVYDDVTTLRGPQ